MKRLDITLLLFLVVAAFSSRTYAYDIAVVNADGVRIYYDYINDKQELSVTNMGTIYHYYSYTGSVVIPSEVIYQGESLKVTSIDAHAFNGCTGLTSITIPSSVTTIERAAFYGCTGLTSITISIGVTTIESGAFEDCTGLTSITIPSSVTSIGEEAFKGCTGLTSITIPSSVTSIEENAFRYCYFKFDSFVNSSLANDPYLWGATLYDVETDDGLLIQRNTLVGCRRNATSVIIPNSVTSIGEGAFSYCI